jgi:hypothetical protein
MLAIIVYIASILKKEQAMVDYDSSKSKGGKARAALLSSKERSDIAK